MTDTPTRGVPNTSPGEVLLKDVLEVLEKLYPRGTAQSWDHVGLVTGDPEQPVRRIHLAVDPTMAVIEEARDQGADLLFTHHPLLMRGVHGLGTDTAKGAAVTALIVADIALFSAHTNADVAEPGVCTALATACGLRESEPLTEEEGRPMGRFGVLDEPTTLADFAAKLTAALPRTAVGVRVAGPPQGQVRSVALLGGAGDSLLDAARRRGADVYVTSDLRHHPTSESRESSKGGPPYLIDAGHFATEWLWLQEAAERIVAGLGRRGTTVETYVSSIVTDPWTFVLGAHGPSGTPAQEEIHQ